MARSILVSLTLAAALLGSDRNDLQTGLTLFNAGRYQESLELATRVVGRNPDSPTAHKLLGMDQYMLGHLSEALVEVKRATELAPKDPDAFYYLGRLYFSADNPRAALDSFQKAIAFDPSSMRAYNQLGQTYEALSLRREAEKAYLAAIDLENAQQKKSGWPDYNLGILRLDDGRTQDAINCFHRALERNPNFLEAKIKLAVAVSKEKPVPEAFQLLQDAIQLDPGNAEAHYRLALLLSKSGKRAEAQEQFALFQKYRKSAK